MNVDLLLFALLYWTLNCVEVDDIHTDRTNDSIKHTLKDSDKFDMLGNENKSSNHLQRITSESEQISLTSLRLLLIYF
jgi:hypothetical protein